jgi:hypothetical protein
MGHAVGEVAHLGVAALLAGVLALGIWESDYLLERYQDATTRPIAAHRAQDPIVATGSQLARFTEGADDGVRSGC